MSKNLARTLINAVPEIDHRIIGCRQNLFFFNGYSQGSCFFEPRGARIYNKLVDFLRNEYRSRKYDEVITPNIFNCQLWEKSGHWDYYKDNMIRFKVHDRDYSLKPMNCPGHCVMFKHQTIKSKDELPVRWADFGVLHRNELSGSLIGLTRVRRFQQDDAHIFCTQDQVKSEVKSCLKFAKDVYTKFGFSFEIELSLRPTNYLGDSITWDKAEQDLRSALDSSGITWAETMFEGAFYGPKIDLKIQDCFGRYNQCATIQLDFQMPEKFDLIYKDTNDSSSLQSNDMEDIRSGQDSTEIQSSQSILKRPVIIHRAIFGSIERFIAMIAENCRGLWPFWLSPLQLQIVPVHENYNLHAERIRDRFRADGFWVDCDTRRYVTLGAKIREAQLMPYSLIGLLGQREVDTETLTLRIAHREKNRIIQYNNDGDELSRSKAKFKSHNMKIEIGVLVKRFREFEECYVDRADRELAAAELATTDSDK